MKTIKNNKENQGALKLIDKLMDKNPDKNSKDGKKLKQLATLVQNYEKDISDKCTLWENIWWPISGFLERIFRDKPREIKWFFQRGKRGYSDCDAWGLYSYLLDWLPKAIRNMRDCKNGYPMGLTFKKWQKILTKMAKGFDSGKRLSNSFSRDKKKLEKWKKEFDEGMKLFHKHFFSLWD